MAHKVNSPVESSFNPLGDAEKRKVGLSARVYDSSFNTTKAHEQWDQILNEIWKVVQPPKETLEDDLGVDKVAPSKKQLDVPEDLTDREEEYIVSTDTENHWPSVMTELRRRSGANPEELHEKQGLFRRLSSKFRSKRSKSGRSNTKKQNKKRRSIFGGTSEQISA